MIATHKIHKSEVAELADGIFDKYSPFRASRPESLMPI